MSNAYLKHDGHPANVLVHILRCDDIDLSS